MQIPFYTPHLILFLEVSHDKNIRAICLIGPTAVRMQMISWKEGALGKIFFAHTPSGENGFKCSDTCVLRCRSVLQNSAPLGVRAAFLFQADWETWHSALSPEVELFAVLHCGEQSLLLQQLRNWSVTHLLD